MIIQAGAAVLITLLVGAFAHPAVALLTRLWIHLCTWPLEPILRSYNREIALEDFASQDQALMSQGYGPQLRAVHLLLRLALSLPSDCAVAADAYYIKVGKRAFDIVFAGAGVLLMLPLWTSIAGAIRTTSSGPILLKQTRVGHGGRPFTSFLFWIDAERSQAPWISRFLIATSLSHLPLLINVLLGHITLVGPSAPLLERAACYTTAQKERFIVRPGLTCLWQTCGERFHFDEEAKLAIKYVRKRGLLCDITILIKTLPAAFRR